MTAKFINSIKSVFLFCISLLGIVSCERDFENVGVSLVDNNLFDTSQRDFEVVAYTKNVDSSRVDNVPIYNLGIYKDDNFGAINTSFVTQIGLTVGRSFGLNPVIDTVIIDIPYFSTRQSEDNSDGTPNFELDSILGNQELEYTMTVKRLSTFLNLLDPNDPTRIKRYYSDETYDGNTELYSGLFKPNKNDTVLFVKRSLFEGTQRIDTIKEDNLSPSIKLPLDETEIERIFITEPTESDLASLENFVQYFRGFLFETSGSDGSLMSLSMSDATFNIYYTNEILTDEEGVDLNGDGDTDDMDVPVKTKQTLTLPFSGIRASTYVRDYSGADIETFINTPNITEGEENLYVQGSAGSIAEIDLFKDVDLDEIRDNNWLINGAILDLYVVDDPDNRNVPERLYLYNAEQNSAIRDVISERQVNGIGGFLEREDDTNRPIRYRFSITDYISEVLKSEDPLAVSKLAVKVYHPTDDPAPTSFTDTIIRDFSWVPKGVVLRGNKDNGSTDETRLKLRIYYTENNN